MPTLLSANNYYYRRGGAESVFFEHNELLGTAGWNVIPFSMHHEHNLPSEWSPYFIDEIEFGRSYSLPQKVQLAQKISYSFEAKRKIRDLIERTKPDLLHAHNIYHHISPSILPRSKSLGLPVVLTLHDLKIACPAYKMLTHDGICERCKGGAIWNVAAHRCVKDSYPLSLVVMLEAITQRLLGTYQNVDRFVVPSRFYVDKLVSWGWSRDRFTYIPNFVDITAFEPAEVSSNAFLYFGRLGHEKGLHTLVKAAAKLKVPLHIAGTGPEEASLKQLSAELQANVTFLGYLTGKALHDAVRASRAVVLPSEWYENAPLSVMEAYALGRPLIGANIGGIPELIRPGETGAIFESGQVDSLAEALSSMAALPNTQLSSMGKAGRDWMGAEFSSEKYRERILALYGQLGVPS